MYVWRDVELVILREFLVDSHKAQGAGGDDKTEQPPTVPTTHVPSGAAQLRHFHPLGGLQRPAPATAAT